MKKRHFKNAALVILSFLCLLFLYINVYPDTRLLVIRDLPIVKGFQELSKRNEALNSEIEKQDLQLTNMNEEIEALAEQEAFHKENSNKTFVLKLGYAIELLRLEGFETDYINTELKYEMIDKGLDFTFAVLDDDKNIIKRLSTSELFEDYLKSVEIEDRSLMNDTQRLFGDLKGKTLSKFDFINGPFEYESVINPREEDYTLIMHYYCNDFDDGKIIIQVLHFEKINGEYLVSSFGRDA